MRQHLKSTQKKLICDFKSISETAFKIHTEETHNQEFNIQRTDSITKSPPLKKSKDHHDVNMDIDMNETMQIKDNEINCLENMVKELQHKLEARKANNKSRDAVDVNVDIIEVLEEEIISEVPETKPPLKIGKARPKKQVPSVKNVSVCSHRQELILEDIPEFEFKCYKCGKGFRHKGDLSKHMTCHIRRFCDCAFPCTPINGLKGPEI